MVQKVHSAVRLPSLDGWRALAVGMVMLSHFAYSRGAPPLAKLANAFDGGDLGVRVFFVISGLLITYLLLAEADRGEPSLASFYTRRVLRIFPVYFLYVAVVALLAASGWYSEARSSWIGTLTFTRDVVGRGDSVTVHYWSLAVEEQFYLLWPSVLVALGLWRRPRTAVVLLLVPLAVCPFVRAGIVQAHWPNPWIIRALGPFSIAQYADSLAIGCLGAFVQHTYSDRVARFASGGVLAFALTVFVAGALSETDVHGVWLTLIPPVEGIAVVCAIWVTINRRHGAVYRLLNTRTVAWIGTLSYSLYVWQQLFLSHFAGPRLSTLPVYDWRVWWLAALVVASMSYYLIERPVLRVRDRLRAQLLPTAARAAC